MVSVKGLIVLAAFLAVVGLAVKGPNTPIAHIAEAAATVIIVVSLASTRF